jgi:hypothetical protein
MDTAGIERILALVVLATSAIVAAVKIPDMVIAMLEAKKKIKSTVNKA